MIAGDFNASRALTSHTPLHPGPLLYSAKTAYLFSLSPNLYVAVQCNLLKRTLKNFQTQYTCLCHIVSPLFAVFNSTDYVLNCCFKNGCFPVGRARLAIYKTAFIKVSNRLCVFQRRQKPGLQIGHYSENTPVFSARTEASQRVVVRRRSNK